MEECLEAMLEEERQHQRNMNSTAWSTATGTSDNNAAELCQQLSNLRMPDDLAKQVITKIFSAFIFNMKKRGRNLYQSIINIAMLMEFLEHAKSRRS